MTKIKPFKAIRPTRDKAHLVVTKPVSSYSKTVLKARLESNPYTFIRIIHPEFDKSIKTAPNSKDFRRLLSVSSDDSKKMGQPL